MLIFWNLLFLFVFVIICQTNGDVLTTLPSSDNNTIIKGSDQPEFITSTSTSVENIESLDNITTKIELPKMQMVNETIYESSTIKSTTVEQETDSSVPNFQSFEEWKKNKLNQDRIESENITESNRVLEVSLSNSEIIRNQNIQSNSANTDIIHRDKDDIPHRMKTRNTKDQDSNNNDEQLGEEMVIEISMFAGTSEEQGKLYQDRFNFASFDCAATIVKTNKEAKGANAILVENKDSYLLNECNAQNKFIIIELCEDILVDEVLIGNYEFYSSMFKDIRISVSDRFPATHWMVLGEFEAENIRKLQTFKIENPLIWAKFLKIEFLTQYGNEFYCPISSVQVHGKTMIEQLKEEDSDSPENLETVTIKSHTIEENAEQIYLHHDSIQMDMDQIPEFNVELSSNASHPTFEMNSTLELDCSSKYLKLDQFLIEYEKKQAENYDQCLIDLENQTLSSSKPLTTTLSHVYTTPQHVQPQDSIYKNIVKRLSLLESNATLSLLYIEEQSKLLSDAFLKLESQQSNKFQNILLQLNSTIQSQMDIFQKLNTDVYTSFSRLFEYQQHNFDSRTHEISKQLEEISSAISFYKNLTYFCIFLLLLLFIYILLTKDLYIDETYLSSYISKSPNFSPPLSPTNSSFIHSRAASEDFHKSSDDDIEDELPFKSVARSKSIPIYKRNSLFNNISKSWTSLSTSPRKLSNVSNLQTPEPSRSPSPGRARHSKFSLEEQGSFKDGKNIQDSYEYEYVIEGDQENEDSNKFEQDHDHDHDHDHGHNQVEQGK
jgi:hypothetical protein